MEENRHEDIDMIYILRSIRAGIGNAFKSIGWLIEFSISKIIPLSVFIAIGIGIGLEIYNLKEPYYKNEMVISHSRFNNSFCFQMIDDLNSYINKSSNNKGLAKILNISENSAKQVKHFSYVDVNKSLAAKYADSISMLLPFKVEVEIYDKNILADLQSGILKYLENNEYALARKELEKQNLDKMEERLNLELASIELLKEQVNKGVVPQSTGTGIILGEPINPVTVYEASMKLYERKLRVLEKKKLNDSFYLVVGFSESKRTSLDSFTYLLIGFLGGYLAGILYLLRRRARKTTPSAI